MTMFGEGFYIRRCPCSKRLFLFLRYDFLCSENVENVAV